MKIKFFIFLMIVIVFVSSCSTIQEVRYPDLPEECTVVPKDSGCMANIKRYYYDPSVDTCKVFYYGGCGTSPPFQTETECHNACIQRFGPGKELSNEDIRYELNYLRQEFNRRLEFAYDYEKDYYGNEEQRTKYINSILSTFTPQELGLYDNHVVIRTFLTFPDNKIRALILINDIQDGQSCLNNNGIVIEHPDTQKFVGCVPKLGFSEEMKEDHTEEALVEIGKCEVLMGDGKCFGEVALQFNNPSLCELAPRFSDIGNVCIQYFIEERPSAQTCNNIKDYGIRASCWDKLQEVSPGVETCEAASDDTTKDLCLQNLAYKLNDSSLCYRLSNTERRQWKDECIVKFVYEDVFGAEECKEVEFDHQRSWCIGHLSGSQVNPNSCDYIKNQQYKEGCIGSVAIKLGDVEMCNQITPAVNKESCIRDVAITLGNVDLCSQITSRRNKESCIGGVAIKLGNVDLCSQITLIENKESCIEDVAIKLGDVEMCNQITTIENNRNFRNICIYAVQSAVQR